MATVRQDIFTGNYVIIATERGNRPITIKRGIQEYVSNHECPFCIGNEHLTPPALYQDASPWTVRSFANKYPVLSDKSNSAAIDGGQHEVLVDTPEHCRDFRLLDKEEMRRVLGALWERHRFYFKQEGRNQSIQIFKNSGLRSGASQAHSHWQILCSEFLPSAQGHISQRMKQHRLEGGGCLYCEAIEEELRCKERIIFENDEFIALSPYAPRFTYEVWLLPKVHYCNFSQLGAIQLDKLAETMYKIFSAYNTLFPDLNYNILMIENTKAADRELFHWHIQILPRMGTLAGYELSTGTFINHISPEFAAGELRRNMHPPTD